jgi:hypothetical protein
MVVKNRPICFIAMAFSHDDTDALYDKAILPVLRRNGIKAIRIDRSQKNDDLNIQIIEELKTAHLCISDLTYARPSVYYEAGFAQRSIPVIYTVRQDHLRPKGADDPNRVHFDLQMKNLITWKDPYDVAFFKKLKSRIKASFLASWNRIESGNQKLNKEITKFENKTINDRLRILRRQTVLALYSFGYTAPCWYAPGYLLNIREPHLGPFKNTSGVATKADYPFLCASKERGRKAKYVTVQAYVNITKQDIAFINNSYINSYDQWFRNALKFDIFSRYDEISIDHFLLGLDPLPTKRIESALDSAEPLEKGKCYKEKNLLGSSSIEESRKIETETTWHFLTGIQSVLNLKENLRYQLDNYFTSKF